MVRLEKHNRWTQVYLFTLVQIILFCKLRRIHLSEAISRPTIARSHRLAGQKRRQPKGRVCTQLIFRSLFRALLTSISISPIWFDRLANAGMTSTTADLKLLWEALNAGGTRMPNHFKGSIDVPGALSASSNVGLVSPACSLGSVPVLRSSIFEAVGSRAEKEGSESFTELEQDLAYTHELHVNDV